jgi:hypothetical protein
MLMRGIAKTLLIMVLPATVKPGILVSPGKAFGDQGLTLIPS